MAKMLTLPEAAEILGVSPGTLRVQANNGKLRAKKIGSSQGGLWLVSEAEVERYRSEVQKGGSIGSTDGSTSPKKTKSRTR